MSKVGLATKGEIKFFSKVVLESTNVSGILGYALKIAAPMVINAVDDNLGDKIPEPWQTHIEKLITMLYDAGQDNVITKAEEAEIIDYCVLVLNEEIDIKYIDEDDEGTAMLFIFKGIASLIRKWVKKEAVIQ